MLTTRRALLATVAVMTLLNSGGCEPQQDAQAPQPFPLSQDAVVLLESMPGSPWSGTWAIEGASLDGNLRITHLEDGTHAVEGIGTVNAVMHGTASENRLEAREGGRGNRIELTRPLPDTPCAQGWQLPPSTKPVSMLVCRRL